METKTIKSFDEYVILSGFVIPEYWSLLPKHIVSQLKIELVIEFLNEGWKPNLNDNLQKKWLPYFTTDSGKFAFHHFKMWSVGSDINSRLILKSRELCIHIGQSPELVDLYKDFVLGEEE